MVAFVQHRILDPGAGTIRSQFLIESVLLTGVLGVALGLAATWAICRFTGREFLVSGPSVASGLATATAAGLFFGFQPAH